MKPEAKSPRLLNLALQGGGSHGAFTWGVLDALLEDGRFRFDGISGTSAGAMNAVAMAHGFAQAAQQRKHGESAREMARESLRRFWEGVGALGSMMLGALPMPPAGSPLMGVMQQWFTPYNTNPLDFNPLRDLLVREVDFDLLARSEGPRVFVCATNVRTGRGEIFSGERLSADAVMASACLPMLFKAVEIDGERYWDGGFSGNPALYPLTYQTRTCDTLLVQINPVEHLDLPDHPQEILDRMNEVTFNASLLAELRAIAFVSRLIEEGRLDPVRYRAIRMHRIDGGSALAREGAASKLRSDLTYVRRLFGLGRDAGRQWLADHFDDVGRRSTLDVTREPGPR